MIRINFLQFTTRSNINKRSRRPAADYATVRLAVHSSWVFSHFLWHFRVGELISSTRIIVYTEKRTWPN